MEARLPKREEAEEASRPEPIHYSFSERIKVGIFADLWLNLLKMDLS